MTAQRSREDELEVSEAQITPRITAITQLQHARPAGHIPGLSPVRGSASWLSSHGRGLGPRDALKKDSRGLSWGAAGTLS